MSDDGAGPAVGRSGGDVGEGTSGLVARKASIGDSVDGNDDDTEASAVPRVFAKRPPPLFQNGDKPHSERKVFRKAAKNRSFEVYVFKRDFYEENGEVEPIDGLLAVNPEKDLRGRSIFLRVEAVFHHSYSTTAAMIGMPSSAVLHSEVQLLHRTEDKPAAVGDVHEGSALIPGSPDGKKPAIKLCKLQTPSKLQTKLAKTLEWPTVPFSFKLPPNLPSSVVMNQNKGRDDNNEHLGVDYEVTGFVGNPAKAVPRRRRSTVRLNIRKLAHLSAASTGRPTATETKSFMLSSKAIRLQVTLSKPRYELGEKINVELVISNDSSKTVKSIRLAVRQRISLQDQSGNERINAKCNLSELESDHECPIKRGMTSTQQYDLDLFDQKNHHQPQIAMDGQLHDEDTSLAASTDVHSATQRTEIKGGIHVDYEVKVKLGLGMGSELTCKVPFMLSRPRENLHSVVNTFTPAGKPDLTPVYTEPEMQDTDLVFEDFLHGRAEKFFADIDDEALAPP